MPKENPKRKLMICAFIISNLLINDAKIVINIGINAKNKVFL